MRRRLMGLLTAGIGLAALAAADGNPLVFRNGFDGTADRPTNLTDACSIQEMPPSLKSLAFKPADNKASDVYRGLYVLPHEAQGLTDYEFRFRFRFPSVSRRAFGLTLVSGSVTNRKAQSVLSLAVSEKGMTIKPTGVGVLPPSMGSDQELDFRPIPPNLWHRACVRVSGRVVEWFVENDGVLRKFAQAERTPAPLIGFNFNGATAFSLDDIEIRRLPGPEAGDFRTEGNSRTALREAIYTLDLAPETVMASCSVRLGTYPGSLLMTVGYADGTQRVVDVKTFAASYEKPVLRTVTEADKAGKLASTNKWLREKMVLPDAGLMFRERIRNGWNLTLHTRPNLKYRYTPEQELSVVAQWADYPAASESFIRFDFQPEPEGLGLWLDGRYAGRIAATARVTSVSFTVPAGAVIRDAAVSREPLDRRYLPLDVAWIANPGALADAVLDGVRPGPARVEGVPFIVRQGAEHADTGVCREGLGSIYLECDGYLSRTPFDGMPESLLFGVPVAMYHRAWALCARDPDPGKNGVITARLTKFKPESEMGRGYAIADTEVTIPLPGEPLPPNVKRVGEVKTGGRTLPLYRVEFAMGAGNIQEIVFQEKPAWLDFEVLGKRNDTDNFYFDRSRKPADDPSGVHVFGLTLERAPVEMDIRPGSFGNYYKPGQPAGMSVALKSTGKTVAILTWQVRDLAGRILETEKREFTFGGADERQQADIRFGQTEPGWYGVDFVLSGPDGQSWLRHDAMFARIEADTRQAGYDSPFFAWNFGGPHGTLTNLALIGQLLKDAGIRHTHVASEKAGEPWTLTMGQIPRLAPKSKDPQEADREMEKLIKDRLARFPHATMALIFHESGGGPFPLELLGGTTDVDAVQAEYDRTKADQALLIAKAYRKYAPGIRLVVGNSGSATPGLLAALFRAKFPREYLDFLGDETVGMTMPPELSVARENWILRETARVFGYGDIPVSACYEWKCRRSRNLGLRRYAEWNVRDILIGLAWKQPLVPTAGLPDVASSYYNTVWGDEAFTPYPQVYPKPTYPAVSTATRVLDRAAFVRMVPTGSRTVYALEFKKDAQSIYALWTARGELEVTLDAGGNTGGQLTDMLGRSSAASCAGGTLAVQVGEGPVYVSFAKPIRGIARLGTRSFPRERPASAPVVVAALDQPGDCVLETNADPRLDVPAKAPADNRSFRRPGPYVLSVAADGEQGACLALERGPGPACPALMQEYAFLKLKQPAPLPGRPSTIGLWVKGNSSWGKVFWELEDAEGERWLSAGSGGYGCDAYDWPEQAGLNFDGWHFLQFPITALSPVKVPSPGETAGQWQHDGSGNGRMDYPLKATGVAVSMPRQTLNLLEMEPVESGIRLKNLSAY